jgi:glucose-1-phosphate cytidylyltransferase
LDEHADDTQWEKGPLVAIANNSQLAAYKHDGFWKCMDAMRDRIELESLWNSGNSPWKTW